MRINHNIASLNSYRQLSNNTVNTSKSLEKLSSGFRINRAGDDAAGLAISEKMRAQIKGLAQAQRNAQDGISLIQTAEGALNETHSILQRMRELGVQAANDTLSASDRTAVANEITELRNELDRIGDTTTFNGKVLLNGSFGLSVNTTNSTSFIANTVSIDVAGATQTYTYTISANGNGDVKLYDTVGNVQAVSVAANFTGTISFDSLGVKIQVNALSLASAYNGLTVEAGTAASATFKIGAGSSGGEDLSISIANMKIGGLGVTVANTDVSSHAAAETTINTVDSAITTVNTERSKLGAYQNRLEHTIANLGAAEENLTASESRIRDVDMAKEMMEFTKNNILTQAATAMLAQANMQPQGVLQLLK